MLYCKVHSCRYVSFKLFFKAIHKNDVWGLKLSAFSKCSLSLKWWQMVSCKNKKALYSSVYIIIYIKKYMLFYSLPKRKTLWYLLNIHRAKCVIVTLFCQLDSFWLLCVAYRISCSSMFSHYTLFLHYFMYFWKLTPFHASWQDIICFRMC